MALVGSRALGTATVNSDTDVVVLADDPLMFRTDDNWLRDIPWPDVLSQEPLPVDLSLRPQQ